MRAFITSVVFVCCSIIYTPAQSQISGSSYQPTRKEVLESYRRAGLLDRSVRNKVYKSTVQANWQPNGDGFWYVNLLKGGQREYIYVDAIRGKKQPAFSRDKLAAA